MGGSGRVYAAWRAMGAETVHAMATHCLISHIYIVFYLKKILLLSSAKTSRARLHSSVVRPRL